MVGSDHGIVDQRQSQLTQNQQSVGSNPTDAIEMDLLQDHSKRKETKPCIVQVTVILPNVPVAQ